MVDLVHVLEYLWAAAWFFFAEGDPEAEAWLRQRALAVLEGNALKVAAGWSIATGIIEGACRHLVPDRMDITGARWSVDGAEAVLKLRDIRANGDFDAYWRFYLDRERERVHESRYANGDIPLAS